MNLSLSPATNIEGVTTPSSFSFPKNQYQRGAAWCDLLLRSGPLLYLGDLLFRVQQHDWRKDHGETLWRWYPRRWTLVTSKALRECPTELRPKPFYEIAFTTETPYEWDCWTERSGDEHCGFSLQSWDLGKAVCAKR